MKAAIITAILSFTLALAAKTPSASDSLVWEPNEEATSRSVAASSLIPKELLEYEAGSLDDRFPAGPGPRSLAGLTRLTERQWEETIHEHDKGANLNNALVICKNKTCNGSCWQTRLSSLKSGKCYKAPWAYHSAFIRQSSNTDLKRGVCLGRSAKTCSGCAYMPRVNTCHNSKKALHSIYRSK